MTVYLRPETEARLVASRLRYWRVALVAGLILMLFVGVGVFRLNAIADNAKDQDQRARQQRVSLLNLAQLLVQCTTAPDQRHPPLPLGQASQNDCYQRQNARTAEVIHQLIVDNRNVTRAAAVAAAVCIKVDPGSTVSEVQTCVTRRLR